MPNVAEPAGRQAALLELVLLGPGARGEPSSGSRSGTSEHRIPVGWRRNPADIAPIGSRGSEVLHRNERNKGVVPNVVFGQ